MDCMYLHHDLLRESLKGRLIENSSACILLVQPFVFFALNSFVMLSAACALKLSMTPTHPDPLLAQGIMSATWKNKLILSIYKLLRYLEWKLSYNRAIVDQGVKSS